MFLGLSSTIKYPIKIILRVRPDCLMLVLFLCYNAKLINSFRDIAAKG